MRIELLATSAADEALLVPVLVVDADEIFVENSEIAVEANVHRLLDLKTIR